MSLYAQVYKLTQALKPLVFCQIHIKTIYSLQVMADDFLTLYFSDFQKIEKYK